MKEIESKFLEINPEKVKEKLLGLGASLAFSGSVLSLFFDTPGGSLKKEEKLLRLRKRDNGKVLVTFKEKINKDIAKIMEENQFFADDFDEAKVVLEKLGFVEVDREVKHRTHFILDGYSFLIDKLEGIPEFLEIEADSVETINEYAEKLGLDPGSAKPWSRTDVLKHYSNRDK